MIKPTIKNCIHIVVCLAIAVATVFAQTQSAQPTVLIKAGRVFDSEAGVMLPARDILVKGNMIDAIGQNLPVPPGAKVIDLTKYTVMPGLIDCHTHLLYLEIGRAH